MNAQKPLLRARFGALVIDYLLIILWMILLAVVNVVLFFGFSDGLPDYLGMFGPIGTQLLFFLELTLPVGLYLYFSESSSRHATVGKRKFGLVVKSENGDAPSRSQIALRTCIKLLPWEIAHTFVWQLQYVFYKEGYEANPPIWILVGLNVAMVLAMIYVAMVIFRKDGRGPHDLIAHTKVVSSRKS